MERVNTAQAAGSPADAPETARLIGAPSPALARSWAKIASPRLAPCEPHAIHTALRVVAFNAAEDWSCDASEDIALEVLERAFWFT